MILFLLRKRVITLPTYVDTVLQVDSVFRIKQLIFSYFEGDHNTETRYRNHSVADERHLPHLIRSSHDFSPYYELLV